MKQSWIALLVSFVLLNGIFFVVAETSNYALAATGSGTINVQMTVPSSNNNSNNNSDDGGSGSSGRNVTPPPPPVDTPPTITGVNKVVTETTATVVWSASDDNGLSANRFEYGLTTMYGSGAPVTGSYQVALSGLATNTLYYFKISVTDTANQTTIQTGMFTTAADTAVSPPIITLVSVNPSAKAATIVWNTDKLTSSEIQYGLTSSYGTSVVTAVRSLSHEQFLSDLTPNTVYHFRIIATDESGVSQATSDSTFTTDKEKLPPPDVSSLKAVALGTSIIVSWKNPTAVAAADFKEVRIIKTIGAPAAGMNEGSLVYTGTDEQFVDSDVEPNIKYFYTAFSVDTSGNVSAGTFSSVEIAPPPGEEICDNGRDDDSNAATDCADDVCKLSSACLPKNPGPEPDNPVRPSGTSTIPLSEVTSTIVFGEPKIELERFRFLAADRTVSLALNGLTIANLSGYNFSIVISREAMTRKPAEITLAVSNYGTYQFRFDEARHQYSTDLVFPPVGTYQAFIIVDYGNSELESIPLALSSRPWGRVSDAATGDALAGVSVNLFGQNNAPIPLSEYAQKTTIVTASEGRYGWVLPEGKYYAKFSAPGYLDFSSRLVSANDNVFNESIQLVARPRKLRDVIDFDKTLPENLKNVIKNFSDQTQATIKLLQNLSNDPQIEQAASTVVAPTAVTAATASSVAFIPWGDLLPLLKLLFLQPVLLIGKRKREGWGQVYNALTKLPIDLAIVRLVDRATGKVIQSRVTDKNGRYYFTANPGSYRLEVVKDKMSFPSSLLKNFTADGRRADVYHGELLQVNERYPAITANIPLDPAGEIKLPRRLALEKIGRRIQGVVSLVGLVATAVSFYISPKWYVGALLAGHIIITVVFRRLAMPPRPKSWGIVYDASNKKPIGRAVARLFSAQFNKLISTQITDAKGRYYFLAGDNRFYVTYEHKEYQSNKGAEINLSGKEIDTIRDNVGLVKKTESTPVTGIDANQESDKK